MRKIFALLLILILFTACTKVVATKSGIVIGTDKELKENNVTSKNITEIKEAIVNYDTPDKVIKDAMEETEAIDFGNLI